MLYLLKISLALVAIPANARLSTGTVVETRTTVDTITAPPAQEDLKAQGGLSAEQCFAALNLAKTHSGTSGGSLHVARTRTPPLKAIVDRVLPNTATTIY